MPSAGDMVGEGKGCATKVSRTNYAAGLDRLVPVRSEPQVAPRQPIAADEHGQRHRERDLRSD